MNKILRFSFVALLAMVFGNVLADTSTLTFTKACGGSDTANDGAVWTITSDGEESNFDNTKGIHYGTGKKAVQYIKLSTSGIKGNISKIVVNASTANGVSATVDVKVDGAAFGGDAKSLATTATDYTFEGNASGDVLVTVTKSESATGALYVKSVEVTYTPSADNVSNPKFSVESGMYFEAQTVELTCSTEGAKILYTIPSGQDPEYTDDQNYTGVFYDGNPLTISKTTTIKAMAVKDGKTSSIVTATYTIIPTEGKGTVESPFSIADALAVINALEDGGTSSVVYTQGYVVGNITISSGQAQFKIGATADSTGNLITVYKAKGLENEAYVEGDAKAGDFVVINAALQKYVKDSVVTPETQFGYIYSINGENSKVTPTLEGDGSENNPFTANDLIIMKKSQRPTEAAWVKGIIRGTYKSKTELDTDKASNIAIATSAEATEFVPVELKGSSVFREKLNVVDNPTNKGKEVKLYGKITDYFSTTGLKDLESAVLDSEIIISGINELKANTKFNGAIYNLAGQRVQTMKRGLYIINGKKVIMK